MIQQLKLRNWLTAECCTVQRPFRNRFPFEAASGTGKTSRHLTPPHGGANVAGDRKGRSTPRRTARSRQGQSVRRNSVIAAIAIVVLGTTVAIAQGGDARSARSLAASCANCHGTAGVSVGDVESLAGKPREEIVRKMQE